MITTRELNIEADEIIKDIFSQVLKSEDKELWKKALASIDLHINKLEHGDRGIALFSWIRVKQIINSKFGKKFISNKKALGVQK